jgi:hypothetical protein
MLAIFIFFNLKLFLYRKVGHPLRGYARVSKTTTDSLEVLLLRLVEDTKPESVSQLVTLLSEHLQISEEQALDEIMSLETEGKIKFISQPLPSPSKISSYLETSQANWYWMATIFALLTLISVFLIPENLQPLSYMRNTLAVIFIVYFPGYTLIKALFPVEAPIKISKEKFDQIERFVLSIAMSLVVVPIVGLLLNYTPLGIGLVPMTLAIFAFSMVFSAAGLIREHRAKMKTPVLQDVKFFGR